MSGNATYGFVLFFNLLSAINAKKAMDGAQLGRNRIRVRLICACLFCSRLYMYHQ